MSTTYDNPGRPFTAGEVLAVNRLIKADGTYADGNATPDVIGVTTLAAASGAQVPVRFLQAGTQRLISAVAITVNDVVYKANDGKVGKTAANMPVGLALTATAGDGEELEVLPFVQANVTALTLAGDGALTLTGLMTAKVGVPASFADLAAVRTYLASIITPAA